MKSLSRVRLLVTPWAAAYQPPLSMGFPRQEYWSGVPLPSPRHFIPALDFNTSLLSTVNHDMVTVYCESPDETEVNEVHV